MQSSIGSMSEFHSCPLFYSKIDSVNFRLPLWIQIKFVIFKTMTFTFTHFINCLWLQINSLTPWLMKPQKLNAAYTRALRILSRINKIPSNDTYFIKICSNLSSHFCLGLPRELFSVDLPIKYHISREKLPVKIWKPY